MRLHELSDKAKEDINEITDYTVERYGVNQMFQYIQRLETAADELADGYGHYKQYPDVHPLLRAKHCQKHYIFGVLRGNKPMLVIAIFHERMNLIEQVKHRLP